MKNYSVAQDAQPVSRRLTSTTGLGNIAPVADKDATGIGVPKYRRMSRHTSGYFFVRRHGFSFNGRAVRGIARCAGSCTRYANLHGSAHPDWRRRERKFETAVQEASMPKSVRRAVRALFPLYAVHVSTLPNQAEARALAALLTRNGKRAVVYRAQQGFTVLEVAA